MAIGTYVLVHGAWHGGWCWAKVARLLRDAALTTRARARRPGRSKPAGSGSAK